MNIPFFDPVSDAPISDPEATLLVYEEIDGVPYYYRDHQAVLTNHKSHEEVMGVSALQSAVVSLLVHILYKYLPFNDYLIATNEPGLHLAPGSTSPMTLPYLTRPVYLFRSPINTSRCRPVS